MKDCTYDVSERSICVAMERKRTKRQCESLHKAATYSIDLTSIQEPHAPLKPTRSHQYDDHKWLDILLSSLHGYFTLLTICCD